MSDGTLLTLSELQKEIIQFQQFYDEQKKALEQVSTVLEEKKRKMIHYMNEAKLTNFKTADGQIVLNRRFAVTVPKGDELQAFLASLAEDHRNALVTVNYQSLNSWYKTELDLAKERGEFDWAPPGLKEPSVNEYLSVKR